MSPPVKEEAPMAPITNASDRFSFNQPSTRLKPGSVKLLTPAEEFELVHKLGQVRTKARKLMQPLVDKAPDDMRLDHFDQVVSLYHREWKGLNKTVRTKIEKLLREYSQIKHRLAVANLPWVTKLSRGQKQSTSIPEEDLFQEGVCGLLKAIDRFEPERGLRLMTYATWYIREAMQQIRARQSHLVSISSHDQTMLGQMEEKVSEFQHKNERQPDAKELGQFAKSNPKFVRQLQAATRPAVSLERSGVDGAIPVPVEDPIPEFDRHEEIKVAVDRLLEELPERERTIVSLRFGLQGNDPRSLEDLGDQFHVSKERIRQIQRQAIRRMLDAAKKDDRTLVNA
jgi:RNA polymerase primary sigma factor